LSTKQPSFEAVIAGESLSRETIAEITRCDGAEKAVAEKAVAEKTGAQLNDLLQ